MTDPGVSMMDFVQATVEELRRRQRQPVQERREHVRYELMLQSEMLLLHTTRVGRQTGDRFACYVRNISRSGMGLLSTEHMKRGDVVGVRVELGSECRFLWATVMHSLAHSTYVSNKIMRFIDIGAAFCPDYETYFRTGLASRDRAERGRYTELLAESGDPVGDAVFASMADSGRDESRCEALHSLGQGGSADAVPPLLKALNSNDALEVPLAHPLYPTLLDAGLMRSPSQLPQPDQRRHVVQARGQECVVVVQPRADSRFVATSVDAACIQAFGDSAEGALDGVLELLETGDDAPDGSDRARARHVLVADLAAQSLRALTGLDLPFNAMAPPHVRVRHRQAWVQEAMEWSQAQARAASESASG